MAETRIPLTTVKGPDQPLNLQMFEVPVQSALVALADSLREIASAMPLVSDLECVLNIEPNGRATLHFRACR